MPLYPISGKDLSADDYLLGLLDGTIGMGRWDKEGNQYNFKIEYDRLTPEEQREVIREFAAHPDVYHDILESLEKQYTENPYYHENDYRGIGDGLYRMLNDLESYQDKPVTRFQESAPTFYDWYRGGLSSYRVCDTPIENEDPFFPNLQMACDAGLAEYAKLPLNRHMSVISDAEQANPKTAEQCGISAFDALVRQAYFKSAFHYEGSVRDNYLKCEAALQINEELNFDADDLAIAIVDSLPVSIVNEFKIEPADLPHPQLIQWARQGYKASDGIRVEVFSLDRKLKKLVLDVRIPHETGDGTLLALISLNVNLVDGKRSKAVDMRPEAKKSGSSVKTDNCLEPYSDCPIP